MHVRFTDYPGLDVFGATVSNGAARVRLTLAPVHGETWDDRDVVRTLTAAEARELASALNHHAAELALEQ